MLLDCGGEIKSRFEPAAPTQSSSNWSITVMALPLFKENTNIPPAVSKINIKVDQKSFESWLHVMSPGLKRLSPLPLPVALLPPLRPGETTLSGSDGLIILIAVTVRLSHWENSAWEHFFQLGGEKGLEVAASLRHFRIGLWSDRRTKCSQRITNNQNTNPTNRS